MRSCPASTSARSGRSLPAPAAAAAARRRADGGFGARGDDAVVGHRASRTAASGRSRALPGVPLPGVAPPRVAPPRVAPPRVAPPRVAPPRVALPRVVLPGVADRWSVWRVAVRPGKCAPGPGHAGPIGSSEGAQFRPGVVPEGPFRSLTETWAGPEPAGSAYL